MANWSTRLDAHEVRKALDDLLQAFLLVSPRSAGHPAVKRARDLVSRESQASRTGSQYEVQVRGGAQVDSDVPESFIVGVD